MYSIIIPSRSGKQRIFKKEQDFPLLSLDMFSGCQICKHTLFVWEVLEPPPPSLTWINADCSTSLGKYSIVLLSRVVWPCILEDFLFKIIFLWGKFILFQTLRSKHSIKNICLFTSCHGTEEKVSPYSFISLWTYTDFSLIWSRNGRTKFFWWCLVFLLP